MYARCTLPNSSRSLATFLTMFTGMAKLYSRHTAPVVLAMARIDPYKLTGRIHQGAATVPGVHGSICLDEGLNGKHVACGVVLEQVDVPAPWH
jgi:hypothetical protein